MISRIEFKNYKSFKAKQSLKFAPITIFIGPNSAGKSSIIKLLGLLTQSLESSSHRPINWRGAEVDLVGFEDASHRRNLNPIEIRVACPKTPVSVSIEELLGDQKPRPEGFDLSLKIQSEDKLIGKIAHYRTSPYRYSAQVMDDLESQILGERTYIYPPASLLNSYRKVILKALEPQFRWLKENKIKRSQEKVWGTLIEEYLNRDLGNDSQMKGFVPTVPDQTRMYNYSNVDGPVTPYYSKEKSKLSISGIQKHWEVLISMIDINDLSHVAAIEAHLKAYFQVIIRIGGKDVSDYSNKLIEEIGFLRKKVESVFKKVEFFPPLRDKPQAFYTKEELIAFTGRQDFATADFSSFVSIYLKVLGFETDFKIQKISDIEDIYRIILIDTSTGYESSLVDVGYGFSQVLPMIFTKTRSNKTIVLEQPELHLHPQAQGKLADLLLTDYMAHTNRAAFQPDHPLDGISHLYGDTDWYPNTNRNYLSNQYIVETHSEHLLRGLQVKVAKGILSPNDVAIYYVSRNRNGNGTIEQININANGFFDRPIPPGFYDSATQLLEKLWESQ